ncbi:MAG: hypothetical protein JO324_02955 [Candidatus Eremiobacteraeota bacterium]|nr:hypothetical protein [Candidatus Eremiobacteraeota bacterium]
MLLMPFIDITSSKEVKTNRVCVAADGRDQRGRPGDIFLPKKWRRHFEKRTSMGGKSPAGTRYQIIPSSLTVQGATLRSMTTLSREDAGNEETGAAIRVQAATEATASVIGLLKIAAVIAHRQTSFPQA